MELKQNVYIYGKYYSPAIEQFPREGDYDIVVYGHTDGVTRIIGSLEGIFVSLEPLGEINPPVRREQLRNFEKKYRGRFIPF